MSMALKDAKRYVRSSRVALLKMTKRNSNGPALRRLVSSERPRRRGTPKTRHPPNGTCSSGGVGMKALEIFTGEH
jgi:hypothetical protein